MKSYKVKLKPRLPNSWHLINSVTTYVIYSCVHLTTKYKTFTLVFNYVDCPLQNYIDPVFEYIWFMESIDFIFGIHQHAYRQHQHIHATIQKRQDNINQWNQQTSARRGGARLLPGALSLQDSLQIINNEYEIERTLKKLLLQACSVNIPPHVNEELHKLTMCIQYHIRFHPHLPVHLPVQVRCFLRCDERSFFVEMQSTVSSIRQPSGGESAQK